VRGSCVVVVYTFLNGCAAGWQTGVVPRAKLPFNYSLGRPDRTTTRDDRGLVTLSSVR
jgi:hypothetical protein